MLTDLVGMLAMGSVSSLPCNIYAADENLLIGSNAISNLMTLHWHPTSYSLDSSTVTDLYLFLLAVLL